MAIMMDATVLGHEISPTPFCIALCLNKTLPRGLKS